MDKQRVENSSVETTWVPRTPIKPVAPVYTDHSQTEEMRIIGNKDGLDHLSFCDLLAHANSGSSVFLSGQTEIDKEHINKTPEKPKRKYRPKVVREVKPKRDPKPNTLKKPDGQESKTPKRKYVRKEKEADEDQDYTQVEESAAGEASTHAKKACRRTLDFEDDCFKLEKGEIQHRENQDQDLQDCHIAVPSMAVGKHSQSRRQGKKLKNDEAQATKRRKVKKPTSDIYLSGIQYDELFEDNKVHVWIDWQQKGMRSHAIPNSSLAGQRHVAQEDVSAFDSSCYSFSFQASAARVLTCQGRQSFQFNAGLDKIDNSTKKKRTTGHARFWNLSSTNKAAQVSKQSQAGWYRRAQNNNNVLAKTRAASSRKKRTTKSQKSQTNQLTLLPNLCQFQHTFAGLSPDAICRQCHSVEAISELMCLLDINREYSETALVPYAMNSSYSIGNQIVLYNGGAGAIVPSIRVKKQQRERVKVHIDTETDRVWNLLMKNIDSEGVDGSDEKTAKWWEEQRNLFGGRADSFIARMHLVQGDRRFTPWKGSVVDSVVGVFLTHSVSDHLSSSAFMSLAEEYPAPVVPSGY